MSAKSDILDAAERVFVENGFSGSSMNTIAQEASVSKSLIYHHFQSKKDLWEQVVRRRVSEAGLPDRIREMVASMVDRQDEPVLSAGMHGTYFDFLRKNPQFVRMLGWIIAEKSLEMGPSCELREEVLRNLSKLQERGVLRHDMDPRMFVVVFMAVCEGWFLFRERISVWFDDGMDSSDLDDKYLQAAVSIMLYGMAGGR